MLVATLDCRLQHPRPARVLDLAKFEGFGGGGGGCSEEGLVGLGQQQRQGTGVKL